MPKIILLKGFSFKTDGVLFTLPIPNSHFEVMRSYCGLMPRSVMTFDHLS